MYAPWVSAVNLAYRPRPEGGNPLPRIHAAVQHARWRMPARRPRRLKSRWSTQPSSWARPRKIDEAEKLLSALKCQLAKK